MIWIGLLGVFGCSQQTTPVEKHVEIPKLGRETLEKQKKSIPPMKQQKEIPPMPTKGVVLESGVSEKECLALFTNCTADKTGEVFFPAFAHHISSISDNLKKKMLNRSWRKGCPIALSELSLLRILHWNEEGGIQWGELIVFHEQADNVASVFWECVK